LSPSLRFLAVALIGWTGIRAASLGMLPGAGLFRITSEARSPSPPPILPTQFAAIPPADPAQWPQQPSYPPQLQPIVIYPAAVSAPVARFTPAIDALAAVPDRYYSANFPGADEWPVTRPTYSNYAALRPQVSEPVAAPPVPPLKPGLDRLQLTAWALLRNQQQGIAGPQSLATRGTLGGSQAGARITYLVTRQIAATLRTSTEVGRRGGEIAGGVRVQPLLGLPLWLTAERRQRVGRYGGGRSAFALFAEAGVYQRPVPLGLSLDAYLQGGIVGARHRDRFIDGAATLTRPVYRQFSAGLGVWGGAQPGVYRLDAGPRVTMRVRNNVRVHFDWRQRIVGNARPGSGPTVTLSGDF